MDDSTYKQLKEAGLPEGLSEHEALERLASFVNRAGDLGDEEALRQAINVLKAHTDASPDGTVRGHAHFFLANAWRHLRDLEVQSGSEEWAWKNDSLEQETLCLRRALAASAASEPSVPICAILTNLGNALSHIGRPVEAIEYYDQALRQESEFAMAIGNRALAMAYYASALYDDGQRALMLKLAHPLLNEAVRHELDAGARECFLQKSSQIEEYLSAKCLTCEPNLDSFSLGDDREEKAYRKWCLREHLFLNPLNDVIECSIAAHDPLSCPSIVSGLDEGPHYHGFYNQLKQEFVSARYLFYEGALARTCHFSDRHVMLHDTLDYPSYGLGVEKTKLAFRAAYSLFDKIAYFLNDYFALRVPEREVSFKTIWTCKRGNGQLRQLRDLFKNRHNHNLNLRGLFWLSKDLFERKNEGWREALEPEAQELDAIRNHLEHKYQKLHEDMWSGPEEDTSWRVDRIANSLYRVDFENKCKRLLKMGRAALIYLALAIHKEERQKAEKRSPDEKVMAMPLFLWDDKWKT